MVWYSVIGLASFEELEAFIEIRKASSPTVW